AIAVFSGFDQETSLVIVATGLSKASEAISDAFYGHCMQRERLDRIAKSMMIKGPLSLLGLAAGFSLTGSVFWAVIGLALARAVIMVGYDLRNASISLNPLLAQRPSLLSGYLPRPRWNRRILLRLARL